MASYRLKQNGTVVAVVSGPEKEARREIHHYAAVYSQDAPVLVERVLNGKWTAQDGQAQEEG